MPSFEIEVKFYIKNYNNIIKKTAQYAGKAVQSGFEKNILFDTKDFSLRKNNKILRLRSYMNKTIMTFKKPPEQKSSEFKILEETETEVQSFQTMRYILNQAGFVNEQIYEKERSLFKTKNLEICIDRLPFGDFIELEGKPSEIEKAADFYAFDWNKRILPSYRAIFEQIKKDNRLNFNDICFSSFKDLDIDFKKSIEKTYKTF